MNALNRKCRLICRLYFNTFGASNDLNDMTHEALRRRNGTCIISFVHIIDILESRRKRQRLCRENLCLFRRLSFLGIKVVHIADNGHSRYPEVKHDTQGNSHTVYDYDGVLRGSLEFGLDERMRRNSPKFPSPFRAGYWRKSR